MIINLFQSSTGPLWRLTALMLCSAALLLAATPAVAQQAPDWENPALLHEGTELPFATMMAFPNAASATTFPTDKFKSPFCRSLNGEWKFNWVSKPDDRPQDFWKTDFSDANWKTIPVPSNVEVQGYGNPIYSNIPYPWKPAKPPLIPHDNNPVSSYRKTFTVPEDWNGREVFLN